MNPMVKSFVTFLAFYAVTKIVVAPVINKVQTSVGLVDATTKLPYVQL